MKKMLLVCIIISFLAGCERSSSFEDYGDTVVESYDRVEGLTAGVNLKEAKKGIRSYRAMNGKYPTSIEEVAEYMGGTFDVEKYDYDPATGKIDLK